MRFRTLTNQIPRDPNKAQRPRAKEGGGVSRSKVGYYTGRRSGVKEGIPTADTGCGEKGKSGGRPTGEEGTRRPRTGRQETLGGPAARRGNSKTGAVGDRQAEAGGRKEGKGRCRSADKEGRRRARPSNGETQSSRSA